MATGVPINGKVLTELRHLAGLNQEEVGFACTHREGIKVAREEMSAYEREEASPTSAKLHAICAVLSVVVGSAEWRALIRTPTLDGLRDADQQQSCPQEDGQREDDQEEDADRHEFLNAAKAGATAAALAPWEETRQRIALALGSPSRLDDGCLDTLERQTTQMEAEFVGPLPLDVLVAQAHAHLGVTLRLLGGGITHPARQRLSVIAGATASLAGWLSNVAGAWGDAHQAFATAAALGHAAGHAGLEARALGGLTQLYCDTGHPADAKTAGGYAAQAVEVAAGAGGGLDAASRSWLAIELASCKAAGKDLRGFQAGVADALECLGGGSEVGIGGRFVGGWHEGVIARLQGRGLLLLRKPAQARAVLEGAVDHRERSGYVLRMICLAEAYALTGEPERACQLLSEAFTAAVTQGFGLALSLICQARARFPRALDGLACVQRLDKRLELLLGPPEPHVSPAYPS